MNSYKRQKTTENPSTDYFQFSGHIFYHKSVETTDRVANRLLAKLNSQTDGTDNRIVVGFDCEWKSRPKQSKVCLIQLCYDSNECHLFHLSALNYKIPTSLLSLISHPNCLKVGLNIESDFWKLQRDYNLSTDDIIVGQNKSVIDLSVLANNLFGMSTKWSLSQLTEYLLGKPLSKDLRLTDWSVVPLGIEQQRYAATDAFVSFELYFEVKAKAVPFNQI